MGLPARTVPLGGRNVPVPPLSSPVGASSAAYPSINQPRAIAQVDAELAKLAELRNTPVGAGGITPQQLVIANAVADYRRDRAGAIAGFQRAANVGSVVERRDRVILPNGETWRALFTYGGMAAELDVLRDRVRSPRDYVHTGSFDYARFTLQAAAGLRANPRTATKFHAGSLPNFERFLRYMESDARIIDIRWMAYMLGTAYWEAARTVVVGQRPNGRPLRQWETIVPISERGEGGTLRYARPVKVQRVGPTSARITEWDGDRFEVTERGYTVPRGMDGGATYDTSAAQAYVQAAGAEHSYFGRGYVQLTWWYNYAMAGIAIGRNFDLVYNPELANDPDIAYKVMADGMITGRHYANGKRIQNYIYGTTADYVGARAIVNVYDLQPTIVEAAQVFEAALMAARR